MNRRDQVVAWVTLVPSVSSQWRALLTKKMAGLCFLASGFISDLGRDKRTMLGRLSWAWLFPCTLLISAANDLLFNFTGEGLFHKKQKKKKKRRRNEGKNYIQAKSRPRLTTTLPFRMKKHPWNIRLESFIYGRRKHRTGNRPISAAITCFHRACAWW